MNNTASRAKKVVAMALRYRPEAQSAAAAAWTAPPVAPPPERMSARRPRHEGSRLLVRAVEAGGATLAGVVVAIGLLAPASPLGVVFLWPGALIAGLAAGLLLLGRPSTAAHLAGVAAVPFLFSALGNFPIALDGATRATSMMLTSLVPVVLLGLVVVMAWGAEERRRRVWGAEFSELLARRYEGAPLRQGSVRQGSVQPLTLTSAASSTEGVRSETR